MGGKYDKAKELLKKYNQEQLLICYDKLSDTDKEKLLDQILNINFDLILSLFKNRNKEINLSDNNLKPIEYVDKQKLSQDEYNELYNIGSEVIKSGKYAVVTMAGGQGTRLGHKAPKGTFEIGNGVNKSLFEALSDTIKEANEEYGVNIPWYIMTSKENNDQTEDFFKQHNFFGFNKNLVTFFKQGELPMIDENGKILVNEKGFVKEASDGHGGVFESMIKNNIVDDMKSKNIEWIFIAGVDNVLANMIDPIATGLAIKKGVLATGKSVVKRDPTEKVGVFCKKNNKPYVVEYSEISKEMSEMRDENGELLFGESHIITNLFNIKALEQMGHDKLPYHSAHKKANYINENGEVVISTKPNAYKFESFIFDAFEKLDDMAILRVKREDEFAPVKNADGQDSPDTARNLYLNFLKKKQEKKITNFSDVSKLINIHSNNTKEEIYNGTSNLNNTLEIESSINNQIEIKEVKNKIAAKNITLKEDEN